LEWINLNKYFREEWDSCLLKEEESPNINGEILLRNQNLLYAEGKCHRKNTVLQQADKGEKVR